MRDLELLLTPADFNQLPHRNLGEAVCVVFDVLRATSTILEAFFQGAESVRPAQDIAEALEIRKEWPDALLAGEREGLRIGPELTGGVPFDLGNSPREFTRNRIAGRRLIMTTTNGTRALRACRGASVVLVASFGNLTAVAQRILASGADRIILVCSGTREAAAYEDILGAGALVDRLRPALDRVRVDDAGHMALNLYRLAQSDVLGALQYSQNGRRLLAMPDLAPDVPICLAPDRFDFVPWVGKDGVVRCLT